MKRFEVSTARAARHSQRSPARSSLLIVGALPVLLTACGSGDPNEGGASHPRTPPYVVQKGCEFTLQISEQNSTSTTIEKGNTMVTLTLSMGDYAVGVSDCRVVDNPDSLPVFED